MKLKKFLEVMNKLPQEYQDFDLVMQSDSEGNGFAMLYIIQIFSDDKIVNFFPGTTVMDIEDLNRNEGKKSIT